MLFVSMMMAFYFQHSRPSESGKQMFALDTAVFILFCAQLLLTQRGRTWAVRHRVSWDDDKVQMYLDEAPLWTLPWSEFKGVEHRARMFDVSEEFSLMDSRGEALYPVPLTFGSSSKERGADLFLTQLAARAPVGFVERAAVPPWWALLAPAVVGLAIMRFTFPHFWRPHPPLSWLMQVLVDIAFWSAYILILGDLVACARAARALVRAHRSVRRLRSNPA
jgi:hypothetical protein